MIKRSKYSILVSMEKIRNLLEPVAFGVCTYISDKFGIPISRVRLFFIYSSFIAAGSPVIVYLALAFFIKMKDYLIGKRKPIWDL